MNTPSFFSKAVALAPMAGVADSSFRTIAMECGASYSVSEMISTKAIVFGNENTLKLIHHTEKEKPFGIQLFGNNPNDFTKASQVVFNDYSCDFIDINMGCPAPKIVKTGAGSALMNSVTLAVDIVRAVVESVNVPVTVKIRSGFSKEDRNAVSFALAIEEAGASAVTIHGRSREMMYKPPVDYEIIRDVVQALSIPVIANGDIFSYSDYLKMREITGCSSVMIGRGSLGNPYIFSEINARNSGTEYIAPTLSERLQTLRRQVALAIEVKGEAFALIEARKHAAWYIKGLRGASLLRSKAFGISNLDDLDSFIEMTLSFAEVHRV